MSFGLHPFGLAPFGASAATGAAPPGDTEAPTWVGPITVGAKTSSTIALTLPTATDNVGVSRYEYRVDGGAWVNNGASTAVALSGLAALTSYTIDARALDAAGNSSTVLSVTASTYRAGDTGANILANTGPVGSSLAGILYDDVEAGDESKWFSFAIVTPPASGTLTINPDGSFTFVGASSTSFTYQLEVDGVAVGAPQTVVLYGSVVYAAGSSTLARSITGYATGTTGLARSVRNFVEGASTLARSVAGYADGSTTIARSISAAGFATGASTLARSVRAYASGSTTLTRSISAPAFATGTSTIARRIGAYVTGTTLLRRSIEGDGSIVWPATRAGEANTARVPFDGVRVIVHDADDAAAPVKAVPLYVADTAATVLALDAPAGVSVTPSVAPGAALTTGVVVLAVTPTGAAGTYRVALRISTAGGRESTALVDVVVSATVQSAKTFRLRSTADRDVFDLDFAAKYLAGAADVADVLLTTSADAGLAADARLDVGGVVQLAVDNPDAPGTYQVRTQLQTAAGRRKTGAISVEVLA